MPLKCCPWIPDFINIATVILKDLEQSVCVVTDDSFNLGAATGEHNHKFGVAGSNNLVNTVFLVLKEIGVAWASDKVLHEVAGVHPFGSQIAS